VVARLPHSRRQADVLHPGAEEGAYQAQAYTLLDISDIEITHDSLLSLLLPKEYFDCPQRDSHAVHYILKRGETGVCTLVLCSLATV
jgi:hypothetical protein